MVDLLGELVYFNQSGFMSSDCYPSQYWGRSKDSLGIGYASSWLWDTHVDYLNRGGVDGFIGDGKIRYQAEQVLDVFINLIF
jgi:hypothetical protein